jgi:2-dehydro-3-deoxyphosphogluconate aldolase/(4S)-4-hydroxy-2-oxoglutarate aldolase
MIMANYTRLDVLNQIVDAGLVPVFYHADIEVAKKVMKACLAGGSRLLEFTNRGDFAPEVFKELSQFCRKEAPEVILGVGSIVDEPTAALYIAYGANFVVGSVLNDEVARVCNRRKIPYMPGCGSASEISHAEELGMEIVKVFPGDSVGGPGFIKSILGPTPWTRIMVTGGVETTHESISAWFKGGATAVGVGSNLIKKELIQSGNYDAISAKTTEVLSWIKEVRAVNPFSGIEHIGLYPLTNQDGKALADWYVQVFGFKAKEGSSSIFLEGPGLGRMEVTKVGNGERSHVAIRVTDFAGAMAALQAKGIELEEPKEKPDNKAVYLKQTDPAGNRVHLIWRL